MCRSLLVACSAVVLLAACAQPYRPMTPEELEKVAVDRAEEQLKRGDVMQVIDDVSVPSVKISSDSLGRAVARTKGLKDRYPTFGPSVVAQLERDVTAPADVSAVRKTFERIEIVRMLDLAPAETTEKLRSTLDGSAARGNLEGRLKYLLNDSTEGLPSLSSAENQRAIFRRTLDAMVASSQGADRLLNLSKVFDVARTKGPASPEHAAVRDALPKMTFKRYELQSDVASLFPEFAQKALAAMTLTVKLRTDPVDRLLQDDLSRAIAKLSDGVRLAADGEPAALTVIVGKLQYDERQTPERSQTIMYAYHQVDVLKAALLMPRNASYFYEYATGGAEIEYAFSVKAVHDGKTIKDDLLRNRESRSYSQCGGARVQNVFGGVQPAGFVANDDMQMRCAGSSSPVRASDLRQAVLDRLVREVAGIAPIERVVALNR